jgi:putative ABC transport system permease protein
MTVLTPLLGTLRTFRRTPLFTGLIVATLAVGIGATTLVFSIADGLVLNPFPYPEPNRLVGVGSAYPKLNAELGFWEVLSPPEYLDIANQSRTLTDVVAWDMGNRQIDELGTENVFSAFWWGDVLPTLRMTPAAGRGFLSDEVRRGDPVAIISHRIWQDRFAADLEMIGQPIHISGEPYTLVGVMPPGTLIYGTDLWLPMPVGPERFPRGRRQFQVIARLAPGATLDTVNAELETLARQTDLAHRAEFPEYEDWQLVARTWADVSAQELKPAALALLGAVGFVLLLVCANVASLLLGRAATRRREFAVRSALGASQPRIVGQLLAESVTFSLTGGLLGVWLAAAGVRGFDAVAALSPIGLPGSVTMNGRVLLFALGVSIFCGLIFGTAPAWQAARTNVQGILRAEAQTSTSGRHRLRLQRAFVALEVALAVVLLTGGGLLVRSFMKLQTVDPGFDTGQMLTMRLTLPPAKYPDNATGVFFTELVDRLERVPGVREAAATSQFPPRGFVRNTFVVEGMEGSREERLPGASFTIASPGYFEALGVPLRRGRLFNDRDAEGAPAVAVINEVAADRYFGGDDAVGRRFRLGASPEASSVEVIGVVGSTRNRGLDAPVDPEIFASLDQLPGNWNQLFMLLRTEGDPRALLPAVRAEVAAMDPEQPIYAIMTVDEAFALASAPRRLATQFMVAFAAFALLLAVAGVYSVVSYGVNQRTPEIGLRMTLGASRQSLRRLIVGQALVPVAVGAGVGLAGAVALGRVMSGLLFDVGSGDPLTLGGVVLTLTASAALASYLPARRASALDPASALKV